MRKQITLTILLMILPFIIQANHRIDSLENVLNTQTLQPDEILKIYNQLSNFYRVNDPEKVLEYSHKGLQIAQRQKDNFFMSRFYEHIGSGNDLLGNDDLALNNYMESLRIAIKANYTEQEGNVYTSIGVFYGMRGQYHPALEYFMKALATYEEKEMLEKCITIYSNIGAIYRIIGNKEMAIQHQQRAMAIAEELGHINGQIQSCIELGAIYVEQGIETELALEYALKAAELSRIHGHTVFAGNSMQLLCKIYYTQLHDYEKAEMYAKEVIRITSEMNDNYGLAGGWNMLSNVYRYQKRYQQSEEAALKAWQIDSLSQDISLNILYNITYANIFTADKEKAASHLHKYSEFNKEHNNKTNQSALLELEIQYETEKKEMRIQTLEKEKNLYRLLTLSVILILLLTTGLLLFAYYLNRQKRKFAQQQVRQLEQEKQLIATQTVIDTEAAERSHLARDLHDGLGGILSAVGVNLSNIKSSSPEIATGHLHKAQTLLKQATGELRRIAHHMMPESLMRYGLKISLEDYCKVIPGTSFHYFGEEIPLDNHLEILLYRCAYELINNSVKHAKATHINVQLIINKGFISLTVLDDGTGFDPQNERLGIGLENIRTRVAVYNGKMNIYTSPGEGTEVTIEIETP